MGAIVPENLAGGKASSLLGAHFFARKAQVVARDLIGKVLVREIDGRQIAAPIIETEAYVGPHDKASHAHRGRTPRNAVMFGPAGYWYTYFIYGMYWMLNVVTDEQEFPAAVLIRGAGAWNGPGKLTRAMSIDRAQNHQIAAPATGLWIEDQGLRIGRGQIVRTPRIGIAYAAEWADKPLRFVLRNGVSTQTMQ